MDIISSNGFIESFNKSPIILTEGSVGLRTINEFGLKPDEHIAHASHIYNSRGRQVLEKIYRQYLQVAQDYSLPILLMTNTRRANKERVSSSAFKDKNVMSDYADFLREVISKYKCEVHIGGYLGCKGDGYTGEGNLSKQKAEDFHSWQMEAFKQADVDFIYATLMPTLDETIGMASVIEKSGYPYLISFMIRENGTIIDGTSIHDAIDEIDNSVLQKPLCYMTNCVHPRILKNALRCADTPLVRNRFKGIQANAVYLSPEELDRLSATKTSSACDLADEMMALDDEFPLKIYGGCCGTDSTHLREFAWRLTMNRMMNPSNKMFDKDSCKE
ncbi:MAG: homocysteine S-methyltransferase family protein [Saccharofermentanales bacterium]